MQNKVTNLIMIIISFVTLEITIALTYVTIAERLTKVETNQQWIIDKIKNDEKQTVTNSFINSYNWSNSLLSTKDKGTTKSIINF